MTRALWDRGPKGRLRVARKTPIRNQTNGRKTMANRYSRILQTIAVLVLVGFVASCKTTSSPGRQVDDAAIKTAVKAKMAADVRLSTLTNIEVNSTNGVVTLSGQVGSESDRAQAAAVARSVDGVVKVNNELQVKR
jgi:hyperosmotically inducible protein